MFEELVLGNKCGAGVESLEFYMGGLFFFFYEEMKNVMFFFGIKKMMIYFSYLIFVFSRLEILVNLCEYCDLWMCLFLWDWVYDGCIRWFWEEVRIACWMGLSCRWGVWRGFSWRRVGFGLRFFVLCVCGYRVCVLVVVVFRYWLVCYGKGRCDIYGL